MAFFIAISFISCKKILVEENLVDKKLIKEVRTLASVVGSKTAFAILSPAEKFALIQEQLSYVIDEIPLTLSQKKLVLEIKNSMPNNVYADSLVRKSFIKVLTAWEQRALKELSKDFMLNYFSRVANLENDITKLNISPSTNDVIAADCSCSTSSDYCEDSANYSYTCGTMNPKDCSDTWGCGTLFIHTCNGKCRRGAPEP